MTNYYSSCTGRGTEDEGKAFNSGGGRKFHLGVLKPIGLLGCLLAGSFTILMLHLPENKTYTSLGDMMRSAEDRDNRRFVHITAQARVDPDAEFGVVCCTSPLVPVDIWRMERPCPLWSVECNGTAMFGDGEDEYKLTGLLTAPEAKRTGPASCNPRIEFISWLIWGAELLYIEEVRAAQRGLTLTSTTWTGPDGKPKVTVTITPPAHIAAGEADDDNLCWFDVRSSRRYVIDVTTCRLESACAFTQRDGREVVLFQTDRIEYASESAGEAAMEEFVKAAGV